MSTDSNPWQTFFDHHAPFYMQEVFTRNTSEEVRFLVDELSLPEGSHIVDVGCGTGRHAIALAALGFHVTGVDISGGMLGEARRAAEEAGVDVDWIQIDATEMHLAEPADAAICLCEGSFGLLACTHDAFTHERHILEAIHRSIKPGAKLILNAPNGLAKIRSATHEQVRNGVFDPLTLIETFQMEIKTRAGARKLQVHERGFVPSELRLLMEITGYDVQAIFGGTAGSWNREVVALDEVEIMAIALRE